jgi:hypothetical protein
MIEVGLLLRGLGNEAVKVSYRGGRTLKTAGQSVEHRIQSQMRERFGVALDWGVPVS